MMWKRTLAWPSREDVEAESEADVMLDEEALVAIMQREPFTIKDSGKRQEFASGMVRDVTEGKIEYHRVLDGPMFERWATHLTNAVKKYPDVKPGVPNWMLAESEEEEQRFKQSAVRHFIQWYMGHRDEDHAAAIFFNVNGAEYVRAKRAGAAGGGEV